MAFALSVLAAFWILFAFVVNPAIDRVRTLTRLIPEKRNELQKVRDRSKEYAFLRDTLNQLRTKVSSQQNSFELLSFLESLVQKSGLEKKVVAMKQQVAPLDNDLFETIIEVRFQNLTLRQLVDFLCKAESSPVLVKTKTLHITKDLTNPDLLDSTVEIHSAKLIQGQVARIGI
jgi:hypothetical protein